MRMCTWSSSSRSCSLLLHLSEPPHSLHVLRPCHGVMLAQSGPDACGRNASLPALRPPGPGPGALPARKVFVQQSAKKKKESLAYGEK